MIGAGVGQRVAAIGQLGRPAAPIAVQHRSAAVRLPRPVPRLRAGQRPAAADHRGRRAVPAQSQRRLHRAQRLCRRLPAAAVVLHGVPAHSNRPRLSDGSLPTTVLPQTGRVGVVQCNFHYEN